MAGARDLPHPDTANLVLTDVLFALSDPSRLELVRRLASGPLEVAACQPTGGEVPKSTLSHHLKTLREAGVIRNVPQGRQRYVSLRRDDLDERFPGLLDAVLGAPAR
ncbi:transcriptional regulator [Microbispora rosea subsp. aerata]|nr:metalloregulator ArsR/SmtB family transcription factor [Microbispora rosea]GGO02789.1 transcriptional regulator [Microbispora rosea subsp. aerata]GIH54558.1 transcriptional regulator [Microbispora rosea subsp. aerata]GLJ87083.1 transcriptional regulator [Microbispora rosea subsp. aerata]